MKEIYPVGKMIGGAGGPEVLGQVALAEDELPRIVVVDGDASTGKTTQAELLAKRLGYSNVTTGMLFCAASAALDASGVNLSNLQEISTLIRATRFDFDLQPGGRPQVSIDGKDISGTLFSQANKQGASRFNKIPEVSNHLESILRQLATTGRWVFDRGARVFPDADFMVWLSASNYIRAVRRCGQIAAEGGYMPLQQVIEEQAVRTRRDSKNHKVPSQATQIDTTWLGIEEVYDVISGLMVKRSHPD